MSIEKLTVDNTITYIVVLLGCLCPGFLILYLYFSDIIKTLDSTLILVFSTSLILPILLIHSLIAAFAPDGIKLGEIEDTLNAADNSNKFNIKNELAIARNAKLYMDRESLAEKDSAKLSLLVM